MREHRHHALAPYQRSPPPAFIATVMPIRPVPPIVAPPNAFQRELVLPGAIIAIDNPRWFIPIAPGLKLPPGRVAPGGLRIPVKHAEEVLRGVIHLVADVPADAPPTVVWVSGHDELLVRLDKTRLACASGIATISLVVTCDEVRDDQRIDIAFAVGTLRRPTGLVMSTFDRVQGPAVITDTWTGALTAFAWEALVTMAQQLAAAQGKDSTGKPLVPASIAAEPGLLLINSMARNALTWTGGQ